MTELRRGETGTAERILDTAEHLVQTRGFNGFSYADVAQRLGVTKASLHYHYASKAQLGEALITRYTERFTSALADIDATGAGAPDKLAAYAVLYADVLAGDRMCLCGMLAAEYETLMEPMRDAIVTFFDLNEEWLARVLDDGVAAGEIRVDRSTRDAARAILGGLEGAMLVARPYGDLTRFHSAARGALSGVVHTDVPIGD